MKPARFWDLPPEMYPFTIEFFRADEPNSEALHTIHVTGAGAIEIPHLATDEYQVDARIRWGDGTVT